MWKPRNIYGIHDRGGEALIVDAGREGWVVITEAIGYNPNDHSGADYSSIAHQIGIIVRINNAYGEHGTIPRSENYDLFAQRCANFVGSTIWNRTDARRIWIIGNEPNYKNERPHGEYIDPEKYVTCYSKCRTAIHSVDGHAEDEVLIAAVAPWNIQTAYSSNPTGDWLIYFEDILKALPDADGIALHTYTHGTLAHYVQSSAIMNPPYTDRFYHFRAFEQFMERIPPYLRHVPVYITETDQNDPWLDGNNGWVQAANKAIDDWNRGEGAQQILCLSMYRWEIHEGDKWPWSNKPGVQEGFRAALEADYQWLPGTIPPGPPPVDPCAGLVAQVEIGLKQVKFGAMMIDQALKNWK